MNENMSCGSAVSIVTGYCQSQSQSYITTDSQSASPSWCQVPIWDRDHFIPFSLRLFLDSYRFVDVGRPLWREVGSVVFSFCRALPAQPFSDLSSTGLTSIFYCPYFLDSRNLEGQVPVFISTRNKVAQLYPRALGFWLLAGQLEGRSLSPGRVKNILLSTSSRPVLGPTQPPIQWVLEDLSPGVKRQGERSWPLTSDYCRDQENIALFIHSPVAFMAQCTGTTLPFYIYIVHTQQM
jgi:hypothetical protein